MRFVLILTVLLLSVSYVNCLEITEVESDLGTAFVLSGEDLPVSPLFGFDRETTEKIAQALEEKELLEEDYEALDIYCEKLEAEHAKEQGRVRWLRRLLLVAGVVITAESIWLAVK